MRQPRCSAQLHLSILTVGLVLGALTLLPAARAGAESAPAAWENPFAPRLDPHPGRLVLNLQAASLHDQGLGFAVGWSPWGLLELKASYGYWVEHSIAGIVKINILPRAALTPYIPLGYTLGVARLPYGLTLLSHRVFAGVGLQVRFLQRYFLAGEITANVALQHHLKDQSESYDFDPTDRLRVRAGFLAGVYLL